MTGNGLLAMLDNPSSFTDNALNTFAVPSGNTTRPDPGTTYWVTGPTQPPA